MISASSSMVVVAVDVGASAVAFAHRGHSAQAQISAAHTPHQVSR
jgi:hypothetical protein